MKNRVAAVFTASRPSGTMLADTAFQMIGAMLGWAASFLK